MTKKSKSLDFNFFPFHGGKPYSRVITPRVTRPISLHAPASAFPAFVLSFLPRSALGHNCGVKIFFKSQLRFNLFLDVLRDH